jgi:simple sugar transport system permease protein
MEKIRNFFVSSNKNTLSLFVIALAVTIIMGILAPRTFLSAENFQSMSIQFAEYGVLAFGMMLAIISGGFDLSLVGIANLSGIIAVIAMKGMGSGNATIPVGIFVALLVGLACGALNGFMIGYMKVPAMLVTLCGQQLYTGIGLIITKGPALQGLPDGFSFIDNGVIGFIPMALIIFAIVAVGIRFLLNSTVYGQHLLYMGTNETASRYSGIRNLKITVETYMISGVLGAIGGILMASHYNSVKPDYGATYILLIMLIAVLGGTNPDGGDGSVLGVTLAIIVLQLISSSFNIIGINSFMKTFIYGVILLVVMIGLGVNKSRKSRE